MEPVRDLPIATRSTPQPPDASDATTEIPVLKANGDDHEINSCHNTPCSLDSIENKPLRNDEATAAKQNISMKRKEPKYNSEFYFEFATFLVEDELFKIPTRYLKENSAVFRTMLDLPQTQETEEGKTDSKPIKLEAIQKIDFTNLLRIIFHIGPDPQALKLDEERWLSVLMLANMWELVPIRDYAIKVLSGCRSLSETAWVHRGREYFVPQWIAKGYTLLVLRDALLTVPEAHEIGFEEALKVAMLHGKVSERVKKNVGKRRKIILGTGRPSE
ncbi:hypothetical protein ONZ45_g16243 [Pleurotus djamor]|nr:hypothetical protein ONZ45_g16243 [Pleurotus djamor]